MTILKSTKMVGPDSGVSLPGTSETFPFRHGDRSFGTFPISHLQNNQGSDLKMDQHQTRRDVV